MQRTTGNVGIGTTSPNQKLQVQGGDVTIRLDQYGDTQSYGFGNPARQNDAAFIKYEGVGNFTGDLHLGVVTSSANVPASEVLTIYRSGDVGIGTTSPGHKLDVAGDIGVGQNDGFYVNNTNVGIERNANDLVLGGYGGIRFKSSATNVTNQTERMRLTSAGNLGIGTTSPTEALTVEGNISASGDLYLDGAIFDSNNESGASGQVLQSTGTGIDWVDSSTLEVQAEQVYATVKNLSGGTLYKGTPVHAVPGSSSGNVNPVIAASASVASTMPATFILNEDLADEAEGLAISVGRITNVDTSAFEVGDVVYVGESGGYTNVKPTGSDNLIQNLGVVTKKHASNGSGYVYGSGRSNDIPNLPEGKIWVGSENYSVTSSFVHLDESNERLGIGTDTPGYDLHVVGNARVVGRITLDGNVNNFIDADGTGVEIKVNNDFRLYKGLNTGIQYKGDTDSLGIGTQSPQAKLDVRGDTHLHGALTVTGSTPLIYLKDTTLDTTHLLNSNNSELQIKGDQAIEMFANSTSSIYIASDGDVGIGTDGPAAKLHIAQAADWNGLRITGYDDQSSDYLNIHIGTTPMARYQSNLEHNFYIANSSILEINSGGIESKGRIKVC